MKFKIPLVVLSFIFFASCQFNKSINQDLMTGLTTIGNGLACEDVYLSNGDEKISTNSFTYGDKVFINFNNIEGFKKEDENVFPGLKLLVVEKNGDTIMFNEDLYAKNSKGFNLSPLLLQTNITLASPIHSNNEYTIFADIWDKKGSGTFKSQLNIDVTPNDLIKVSNKNISYKEISLFSEERKVVIKNNKARFNENIYIIFQGLSGYKILNGKVFLGLSLKATDSKGNILLDEPDLVGDTSIDAVTLKDQLAPSFIFTNSNITNPINCEVTIWDKKSDSKIKTSIKLIIE